MIYINKHTLLAVIITTWQDKLVTMAAAAPHLLMSNLRLVTIVQLYNCRLPTVNGPTKVSGSSSQEAAARLQTPEIT